MTEIYNSLCTACPLYLKAVSVCIPGENTDSQHDLLIVGMSPGVLEDLRGRVFIGPAGEILNECLVEAGIDRTAVATTNCVKCYSGKIKPTRTELATCTDLYLRQEIAQVKPRVIVALGDVALLALTNLSGVNKHRGQQFALRPGLQDVIGLTTNVVVVSTYHPAAYLHAGHDPKIKQAIIVDLRAAREILEGKRSDTLEVKEGEPQGEVLGLDVETNSDGRLIVGTLADGCGTFRLLTPAALQGVRRVVGHNIRFDLKVLEAEGWPIPTGIEDSMLLRHLLSSGDRGRFSLEACVIDEFGHADPDWLESKHLVHAGIDIPLDRLTRYCAQDAVYAVRLFNRFMPRVQADPKLAAIYEHITMPACLMLMRIEQQPVPLDVEYISSIDRELGEKIAVLEAEMAEMVGLAQVPNFRSHKVLVDVLYKRLGLKITRVTDHGAPSTAKPVLMALRGLSPWIDLLLNHKRFGKLRASYTKRWLKLLGAG